MKATSIAFERRYSDDSGVEFGVSFGLASVTFQCVDDDLSFPIEELDWLIGCLQRIKEEVAGLTGGGSNE